MYIIFSCAHKSLKDLKIFSSVNNYSKQHNDINKFNVIIKDKN